MSYLSAAELDAIQHMHKRSPFVITGVSYSIFSVARHYGGMTYQGDEYAYLPATDECVRRDVIKAVEKLRRNTKKEAATSATAQMELEGEK